MHTGDVWSSERQRTAIGRSGLSMPLRRTLGDGLLARGEAVLDFGCGRGQDVSRLAQMSVKASGWDPYYSPDVPLVPHDVVMLTYVLNVIETAAERESTLSRAWGLATKVLVVSCRLDWERNSVRGRTAGDGVMTTKQTFQHFFKTKELRALVENLTGAFCISPTPGVVYAFRREETKLAYLARGAFSEFAWAEDHDRASAMREIVAFTEGRGRMPLFEEVPESVKPFYATTSMLALRRLVLEGAKPGAVELGKRNATLNTLLYLGTSLFSGRPKQQDMPAAVQADIKHCFGTYRSACMRADRLLLKIRDDAYVRGAMKNSVGKMTASALYVHETAVSGMPVVLKLYEHCGFVAAGRPANWNILKLDHRGRRVSWSSYPAFDSDPHPTLDWTFGVDMHTLESRRQEFGSRSNRPLLHRKEEFLSPDHEQVPDLKRLTSAEVRAGLYSNPNQIGLEDGWEAELKRCGVSIQGHSLVERS
ncbi:DNA phosphorothioation-associated putative methyltransferase [Rhodococcus sp. MEB041]|uniref:DNA phosphorothioation-associated putative methyltransferase n=1 Tax=Rhodococcus sp. MEB041 TaxID=3040323 RepID=UPI00254A21FC|nr:DNA phosphorothioation-associated putative methyltransferase [Rhodococcus sp. MEB041]